VKPLLLIFVIIALLVAPQIYTSVYTYKNINLKAQDAHNMIKAELIRPGEQDGYVRVVGAGGRFTEKKMHDSLMDDDNKKLQYGYTWHWQGIKKVTASAPGLDKAHHFVNSYLVGFSPFYTEHLWVPLYTLAMRKRYEYDHIQYSSYNEVWQNSRQAFYYTRGDCEDHALILADWLISLGHDARVVVGAYKGGGHAWVVLFKDGSEYLLEATSKRKQRNTDSYKLASLQTDYQPQYQFNRNKFWFNTGSINTTRYSGESWIFKSRFISTAPVEYR